MIHSRSQPLNRLASIISRHWPIGDLLYRVQCFSSVINNYYVPSEDDILDKQKSFLFL